MSDNLHKDQKRTLTQPAVYGTEDFIEKRARITISFSSRSLFFSPLNKMWSVKVFQVRYVTRTVFWNIANVQCSSDYFWSGALGFGCAFRIKTIAQFRALDITVRVFDNLITRIQF
jgi:hypothetical protein